MFGAFFNSHGPFVSHIFFERPTGFVDRLAAFGCLISIGVRILPMVHPALISLLEDDANDITLLRHT